MEKKFGFATYHGSRDWRRPQQLFESRVSIFGTWRLPQTAANDIISRMLDDPHEDAYV